MSGNFKKPLFGAIYGSIYATIPMCCGKFPVSRNRELASLEQGIAAPEQGIEPPEQGIAPALIQVGELLRICALIVPCLLPSRAPSRRGPQPRTGQLCPVGCAAPTTDSERRRAAILSKR